MHHLVLFDVRLLVGSSVFRLVDAIKVLSRIAGTGSSLDLLLKGLLTVAAKALIRNKVNFRNAFQMVCCVGLVEHFIVNLVLRQVFPDNFLIARHFE